MKRKLIIISIFLFSILFAAMDDSEQSRAEVVEEPFLSITGFVEHPINVTYSEFKQLPMVSEKVTCTCVGWPPEDVGINAYDVYTFNWTGVRVSVLLEMAGVKAEAADVVFHASDGYSSSLPLETALLLNIILAVEADGAPLTRETGYPFRLVVPCWWGYKWVKFVERIEVVDYDHKGTWESSGYPDEAEIPGCIEQEVREGGKSPIVLPTALAASGVILLGLGIFLAWIQGRG